MNRCYLFALLAGLLVVCLPSRAQEFQWVKGVEAVGSANGGAVSQNTVITSTGEVYVSYSHYGLFTLGGQTYGDTITFDQNLLAHYDSAGQVLGVLMTGHSIVVTDMLVDRDDNLIAMGCIGRQNVEGSMTIGSTVVQSALRYPRCFIAKWNSAGTLQWLTTSSPNGTAGGLEGTLDAAGRLTVVGSFYRNIDFVTHGARDVGMSTFLMQLDPTGQVQWFNNVPDNTGSPRVTSVAAAPDGTLFATGMAIDSFSLGGVVVTPPPLAMYYVFWLKLSASGQILASQWFDTGYNNTEVPHRVKADATGASYVLFHGGGTLLWRQTALIPPQQRGRNWVLTRLDPEGVPQWVQYADAPGGSGYPYGLSMSNSPEGQLPQLYVAGTYSSGSSGLFLGNFSLPPTPQGNNNGFVAAIDAATGAPRWLKSAPRVQSAGGGAIAVSANDAGQLSVCGSFNADTATFGRIRLTYPATTATEWRGFVGKIFTHYNAIQGQVFADQNANALRDSSERGRPEVVVEAQPGPFYFTTGADGQYQAITELGTYTVRVPEPPLYYTCLPTGPASNTFTTYGQVAAGRDFALQPVANQQDLRVWLTPIGRARPGFGVQYQVAYTNIGTVPIAAATLTLRADRRLTYVGSTTAPVQAGDSLQWNLGNLAPNDGGTMRVHFTLDSMAQARDTLRTTASLRPVAGDLTPADNTHGNKLEITAAYDPNDLAVNYEQLTPAQVQARPWLEYVVRFQNVGTDTAFTVVVRDSLPVGQLDLATVQVVSASHPFTWSLNPAGVLTARFSGIHLPQQAVNAMGSQGFVRFRVRPSAALVPGDRILNRARLHFDYNPPLATNQTVTLITAPTGLTGSAATAGWGLYPNPASGSVRVLRYQPGAGAVAIRLVDALGRKCARRSPPPGRPRWTCAACRGACTRYGAGGRPAGW